jgi:hypothetical protein
VKRALLLAALLLLAVAPTRAADDNESLHVLVTADGSLDMDKCPICHEDDNETLSRSKLETCALCHSESPHAGATRHLRASPAEVARKLAAAKKEGGAEFPLDEEGKIFCGTCHLFHDPALGERPRLASGWLPPETGLPGAIRSSLRGRFPEIAEKYDEESVDAHFAEHPVVQLRLPIRDGSLCLHCHAELVK